MNSIKKLWSKYDDYILDIIIALLAGLVIYTAKLFGNISNTAGKLFIPYILWLLFAAYLNHAAYLLNR